jgi:hypothetical protein
MSRKYFSIFGSRRAWRTIVSNPDRDKCAHVLRLAAHPDLIAGTHARAPADTAGARYCARQET